MCHPVGSAPPPKKTLSMSDAPDFSGKAAVKEFPYKYCTPTLKYAETLFVFTFYARDVIMRQRFLSYSAGRMRRHR